MILSAAAAVLLPAGAVAQTGVQTPSLLPSPTEKNISLSLFGGWASFAHKPVNDLIRFDNMLLTAPVEDGGAGLDKGLDQLTDGLSFGAEIHWQFADRWSAVAGFEYLSDRTNLHFSYDPGSGPVDGFLEYELSALPLYAGLIYSFRFTNSLRYGVGLEAIYFPSSTLHLVGELSGSPDINEEGTVSGIGAAFRCGGEVDIGGPISLQALVRLRFARVGDPEESDGDPIINPQTGESLTLDWSGVDIQVGFVIDLF